MTGSWGGRPRCSASLPIQAAISPFEAERALVTERDRCRDLLARIAAVDDALAVGATGWAVQRETDSPGARRA